MLGSGSVAPQTSAHSFELKTVRQVMHRHPGVPFFKVVRCRSLSCTRVWKHGDEELLPHVHFICCRVIKGVLCVVIHAAY